MPGSRRVLALALGTLGAPFVVPAGASSATTYEPRCVAPGSTGTVMVEHAPTTVQSRQLGETVLVPQVLKDGSPHLLPEVRFGIRQGFAPYAYPASTALPGAFVPTFRQPLRIPSATSYDGAPLLGYTARVEAYDAAGSTRYGFDRTDGYLQVDLQRILAGKRVRVGSTLPIYVTGFRRTTYVHVVSPAGRRLRTSRLRGGVGPNTACGQSYDQISFRGAKPGRWRLVANGRRTSAKAAGGVSVAVRVTR